MNGKAPIVFGFLAAPSREASLHAVSLAIVISLAEARLHAAEDETNPPPPEAFELLGQSTTDEKEAAMAGRRKAREPEPSAEEIKTKDYAQAVRLYRHDIKPAQSKVGEFAQEQSTAYKAIKKTCHIQPAAAKLGFSGIYSQGDDDNGLIDAEYAVVGSAGPGGSTILPPAEQLREEPHDPHTGEVARQQSGTGMTEVDEETARALDANDGTLSDDNSTAAGGPADEQRGEAPADDEAPAWAIPVAMLQQMIAKAADRKSWTKADAEFQKIAAGLPDDVADSLVAELDAKRAQLTGNA